MLAIQRNGSMKRYRSVLSLVLAAIAVFLVSCGGAPVAKGPLYSPTQLAQIQKYSVDVENLRARMLDIPPLVQQGEWTDVQSYIHGPLGELRTKMSNLARMLEPKKARPAALATARAVFGHLNQIDEATITNDSRKAFLNYNEALKDFDAFLNLIPSGEDG